MLTKEKGLSKSSVLKSLFLLLFYFLKKKNISSKGNKKMALFKGPFIFTF